MSVTDGLFTAQLDFGAAAFQGNARWLAIAVQCSGDSAYTALTPRQALTAAPYAGYALSAPWSGLSGVPAGFADWVDNDTTYTAGTGLTLSGGQFSLLVPYRLPQSCASGQVPKWYGFAWGCAADSGGNGDITAVNASTGLTGGGTGGDVTLSADTTYLQHRVSGACLPGNYLKAINPDGSVVCATPSIQIVENFCQINVGQNSGSCSASCPAGSLLTGGGWNSECGTDGGGNIDTDPLFVDANGGNLRLGFGSPAVDTGTNTGCPVIDLDGLPRPADGDADSTATCDMGAYEAGQMFCSLATNTAYTFDKNSGVVINTTDILGNLACLYVDEMGLNHPNATPGIQSGRYWLIRGLQGDKQTNATGFSVNLTLPTTFTPDDKDKVCRYTGSGKVWDCAMSSFTTNSITRNGVSAFSDWAVGNNVGPTAVRLTSFQACSPPSPLVLLLPVALWIAAWFTKKRLAKP